MLPISQRLMAAERYEYWGNYRLNIKHLDYDPLTDHEFDVQSLNIGMMVKPTYLYIHL